MYYVYSMKQIKIFPIFNQDADDIWSEFIKIRSAALAADGIYLNAQDLSDGIRQMESEWNTKKGNFAYGAYSGTKLVGHISGYYEQGYSCVSNLYMLPRYQRKGIGKGLLRAAEHSSSLLKSKLGLISSFYARKFYKSQDYFLIDGEDFFQKSIKGQGHCDVVPLFYANKAILEKCKELSNGEQNLNLSMINKQHLPTFVYRDISDNITAYCMVNENTASDQQQIYGNSSWAKKRVEYTVSEYLHTQQLLRAKTR